MLRRLRNKWSNQSNARDRAGWANVRNRIIEVAVTLLGLTCLGASIVLAPQKGFYVSFLLLVCGGMFFGFAALLHQRHEADVLLRALNGPLRNRPIDSLGQPRFGQARQIHSAIQGWSSAQSVEMDRLRNHAERDSLTLLPNRWHFKRLVEARMAQVNPDQSPGTMFLLDVDDFKTINDSLGHEAGDQALAMVSHRIDLALRYNIEQASDAITGRLGGDEFTIFVPAITTQEDALRLGEKLRRALAEPIEIDAGTANASCSIGIAIARPGQKFPSLLSAADIAMYSAKLAGKRAIAVYSEEMAREARINELIEAGIRTCMVDGSLSMAYQPQFDCATRRIVSCEALLRWLHPSFGQISPAHFVPIAERLGLIEIFGNWVLDEAIKTVTKFCAEGTPIPIAVNVSPIQLRHAGFAGTVKAILKRHGASAHLLELEITESVAMTDCQETRQNLAELRDAGVAIAIDDFGVGYSNLARLIQLPIDRVKIDKGLIDNLVDQIETQILVKTVIDMAKALGVEVLAEGIETAAQLDLLVALGCEYGQGFLVARPISVDELKALLNPPPASEQTGLKLVQNF